MENGCLFCALSNDPLRQGQLEQFEHCYAILDRFPVSQGHTLIIPTTHVVDWFSASMDVRMDMMHAIDSMKEHLDQQYAPHGYNIGMNCGAVAGQTVFHLHVHLIPRYKGDMDNPRGGVRGVIPDKQKY